MNTLILKLGATGDVVRTSSLLHRLEGSITWLTSAMNQVLIPELNRGSGAVRVMAWDDREALTGNTFDFVINLEDDPETAAFLGSLRIGQLFGAFLSPEGKVAYTPNSSAWFDMSLVSVYGRRRADELKLLNRRSYQELVFEGLGWKFEGQEYVLPESPRSDLSGDVAIASETGPVWPMKKWAYYEQLRSALQDRGLKVNFLPRRPTLLAHLADVRAHRCLVSGDTLPMHLALGSGIPGVALFNCTSPWEIHDYGRLTKIVSPLLSKFFYSRDFDPEATTAIPFDTVLNSTLQALNRTTAPSSI